MSMFTPHDLWELGLGELENAELEDLCATVNSELELRIRRILSTGMDDRRLDEFDQLTSCPRGDLLSWIGHHRDGFESDRMFPSMQDAAMQDEARMSDDQLRDIACRMWLVLHRPDYSLAVDACRAALELELMGMVDRL